MKKDNETKPEEITLSGDANEALDCLEIVDALLKPEALKQVDTISVKCSSAVKDLSITFKIRDPKKQN